MVLGATPPFAGYFVTSKYGSGVIFQLSDVLKNKAVGKPEVTIFEIIQSAAAPEMRTFPLNLRHQFSKYFEDLFFHVLGCNQESPLLIHGNVWQYFFLDFTLHFG